MARGSVEPDPMTKSTPNTAASRARRFCGRRPNQKGGARLRRAYGIIELMASYSGDEEAAPSAVRPQTFTESSTIAEEILRQSSSLVPWCPSAPHFPQSVERHIPIGDRLLPALSVVAHFRIPLICSANMKSSIYATEYDAVIGVLQVYIDSCKQGRSEVLRSAFHPSASFFGFAGAELVIGTAFLFDWIDRNGPAPSIQPSVISVDILDSIAIVHLEVTGWSGKLAGSAVRMTDVFTLLKMSDGWKIIQKAFHWHS